METRELTGVADPAFGAWLDLWTMSFPESERVPPSAVLGALSGVGDHLLLVGEECGEAVALAWCEGQCGGRSVALWYLATAPSARNRGLGARAFADVERYALRRWPSARALLWEVEPPDEADGLAARRIGFYRRLGGRVLRGEAVAYTVQANPWSEPIAMLVMVKPLVDGVTDDEAVALCRECFGDELTMEGRAWLE